MHLSVLLLAFFLTSPDTLTIRVVRSDGSSVFDGAVVQASRTYEFDDRSGDLIGKEGHAVDKKGEVQIEANMKIVWIRAYDPATRSFTTSKAILRTSDGDWPKVIIIRLGG